MVTVDIQEKHVRRNNCIIHMLILTVFFGFIGCGGYESIIPERPVYLKRNIDTEELGSIGSYLYVSSPRLASDRIGFGGILIVHTYDINNEYCAFDLACPVEVNKEVRIGKPDDSLCCTCDSCGEKYDLSFGSGVPVNHISKEGLRRYSVSRDGNNNIIVTK